eukprot:4321000-Amphidinium_carterae.1
MPSNRLCTCQHLAIHSCTLGKANARCKYASGKSDERVNGLSGFVPSCGSHCTSAVEQAVIQLLCPRPVRSAPAPSLQVFLPKTVKSQICVNPGVRGDSSPSMVAQVRVGRLATESEAA